MISTLYLHKPLDAVKMLCEEDFFSWFKDVSQDKLMKSLEFKIHDLDLKKD